MQQFTRTELFSIAQECLCGAGCVICSSLGYKSPMEMTQDKILKLIEGINTSFAEKVVIPGSTFLTSKYTGYINKITKKKLYVFTLDQWKKHENSIRSLLSPQSIAIVFTKAFDLKSFKIPHDISLHFLVLPANYEQIPQLREMLLVRQVFYFFPLNSFFKNKFFSMNFVFENYRNFFYKLPTLKFQIPFNHDIYDQRNSDHMTWQFSADTDPIVSKRTQKQYIKISIVIPFCRRLQILHKVLVQISKSTLAREFFEIILVDDGGPEEERRKLVELIQNFGDINLRLHFVPRKSEITSCFSANRVGPIRNLGAKLATGPILLFLDSDILIPETYLEKLLVLHKIYDVVLPVRRYLTELASTKDINFSMVTDESIMLPAWDKYMESFYQTDDWQSFAEPWIFFMTYCLSISKDKFASVGGFRSSYISYGYEDIDLGYRLLKGPGIEFYNFKQFVYHIFHFKGNREITLDEDLRAYQLAMSTRTFFAQNFPQAGAFLINQSHFKNRRQKFIAFYYKLKLLTINFWKTNFPIRS